MNPLTEPGMVPEPAAAESGPEGAEPGPVEPASAEPASAESGPVEPAAAEPSPDVAEPPTDELPVVELPAAESSAISPSEDSSPEAVVLIEPLTSARSVASGHAKSAARGAALRTSALVRGTVALIGRYKLETIAVLLLGVGGAVYPPVWVLGVFVALPSKTWDLRDKWTGLVAPVLLVIVSTVLIVVVGGKHSTIGYAHEAWLGADRASRIAAVLGAGYLFWRLRRGRREPKRPPWEVPHSLG
jgi:hypothetical protein